MNFRKGIFADLILCGIAFSIISCASSKKVIQNGVERKVVIGKAVLLDSTEANDALVSLFDVHIIRGHDSIFNTYSTTTAKNGYFILQGVPDGEYLLYIYDISRGKCDLSHIKKQQNSLQIPKSVVLTSLVTLKGRVINAEMNESVKVIIPGFGASSQLDNAGYYVLTDVPGGIYELAFIGKKMIDYLQVNIPDEISDTVFIKDFNINYQSEALSSVY